MQKFKVYFWKYMPRNMFKDIKEKYKSRLNDYMNVYICDDFEEMYNLADKLENAKLDRDYGARTWCFEKKFYDIETEKFVKTSPCCGHIILNKKQFFMDTVSHESAHAVIGYFSRKLKEYKHIFTEIDKEGNILEGGNECDINEELFCYMVGNIGNQIIVESEN